MLNFSVISKTWWEKIDSIDIWKHIRFLKIVHCFFITWALGLEESHKVMISIDIYYFFRFQNIFLQHLLASTFVYQTVWDHINHSQIMEITVTQKMELFCNFPPQHSVFEWWVPYCLIYFVWAYKFLIKPSEVNISPKISISAQPLKMALHRNPAMHGSRMVIFLHDSKKAPF